MRICPLTSDLPPNIGAVDVHVYKLARALTVLGHHAIVAHVVQLEIGWAKIVS